MSNHPVLFCNINRVEELNKRISDRNIPSHSLKPTFSVRPQSTKQSIFPIIHFKTKPTERLLYYKNNTPGETFNPGTGMGQYSGYSKEINTESILQNRIFANQRCEQSVYVPSSRSDLYNSHLCINNVDNTQPHPGLFEKIPLPDRDENVIHYLTKPLHNSTRTQRLSQCAQ